MKIIEDLKHEFSDISITQTNLRVFLFILATLLGIVTYRFSISVSIPSLFILGVIFGYIFLRPNILIPFYKLWMSLAIVLGAISGTILLTVIYVTVITPTGLLMKIVNRKTSFTKPDKKTKTYWVKKEKNNDRETYLKQY